MFSPKYVFVDFDEREITSLKLSLEELKYSYVTFTGSKLGIDGQVKLRMASPIFPIRLKFDYVALLILQHTQIGKVL